MLILYLEGSKFFLEILYETSLNPRRIWRNVVVIGPMSKCKVPATFYIFTMLKIGQQILVNIPRIKCHQAVLVPCANNRQTDILND